jgi:pimeloyl-ACP methyl ester carboxylesterase
MRAWLISLLLLAVSAAAFAAPDYGREKKWADEITPGVVVGDPLYLTQKNGHKFLGIYTEAGKARMGVVVVHGIGIHPDWGMVGTLRQRLPDHGYATLSIQMPILAVDAKSESYAAHFPEAVERLQLAVAYLKGKGYKRIAVVSHSMGSRMSHPYMARNPAEVGAWASLGMPAALGSGAAITYDGIKAPVLDLYGANDLEQVLAGAAQRKASLKGNAVSKQVMIPNTDHFYADHEDAMVTAVKNFLDGVK